VLCQFQCWQVCQLLLLLLIITHRVHKILAYSSILASLLLLLQLLTHDAKLMLRLTEAI
jgi:hypothetical protein